jgi:hypothetical protein
MPNLAMRWQRRYRDNGTITLAFVLGCIAGIPSLLAFMQTAGWVDFGVYAAFVAALILMFHRLLPLRADPIPRAAVFPGVGNTDQTSELWRRAAETDSVYQSLLASKHKLCVVTGVSGAGKSVLMRALVVPKFRDWHVVIIDNYDGIQVDLPNRLDSVFRATAKEVETCSFDPKTDNRQGTIFIFDQAEQLVVRTEDEINWVRDFIAACLKSENIRCAMVVRQDFYFDLRFLCDQLPNPTDVIDLHGMRSDPDSREMQDLHRTLKRVCTPEVAELVIRDLEIPFRETNCDKGKNLTRTLKMVLPLELQMLGFVLDLESQRTGPVNMAEYRNRLLGKAGLIRKYFLTYLGACDNIDVAWAVLFALSTDSVIQRTVSLDHLEKVTYYSREDMKKVLDLFQKEKLIVAPQPGLYQWSHDALWSGFREISASEMDPTLRDNISYLTERYHRSEEVYSRVPPLTDSELGRRQGWINAGLALVTVIIMITMVGDYFRIKQPDSPLRLFYLPFGFVHLMWALYIYRVRWLYIRLGKGFRAVYWWVIPAAGILCVVTSWWCPKSWLWGLGVCAIVLGVGLLVPSRRQELSNQSKAKFWGLARDCFLFGFVICGIVGSVYFFFVDQFIAFFGRSAFFLSAAGLGLLFSFVAFLTMLDRASPSSVTMYLGLLDRTSRSRTVEVEELPRN